MGNHGSTPTDTGNHSDTIVATKIEIARRKRNIRRITWLGLTIFSLFATIAVLLSLLSLKQNNDEAIQRRTNICLQNNVSRNNTYQALMALAIASVANRPDPSAPISKLVVDYVEFLNQAYEPLNCDPDSPNFGIDTSPPPPLPVDTFLLRIKEQQTQ